VIILSEAANGLTLKTEDSPALLFVLAASPEKQETKPDWTYNVLIINSGCIGAAFTRELSRYKLAILWLEAADDVSQGATKSNSRIVHGDYDDTPNTNRDKYCWKGNQNAQENSGIKLTVLLSFLVMPRNSKVLETKKKRGEMNGVERLRIVIDMKELF